LRHLKQCILVVCRDRLVLTHNVVDAEAEKDGHGSRERLDSQRMRSPCQYAKNVPEADLVVLRIRSTLIQIPTRLGVRSKGSL
jgi:hypothetical protein